MQAAPGDLERVRLLLNSWLIPNDTRVPTDRFKAYARQHRLVAADARELRQLRDDLRIVVEDPHASDKLDPWVEQLGLKPTVRAGRVVLHHNERPAGELLAVVLGAVIDGRWDRLKACPDCRWVFYDHTRNASKRWCLMNAGGQDGRSCGTIAKVRRHRERTRNASTLAQARQTDCTSEDSRATRLWRRVRLWASADRDLPSCSGGCPWPRRLAWPSPVRWQPRMTAGEIAQ